MNFNPGEIETIFKKAEIRISSIKSAHLFRSSRYYIGDIDSKM